METAFESKLTDSYEVSVNFNESSTELTLYGVNHDPYDLAPTFARLDFEVLNVNLSLLSIQQNAGKLTFVLNADREVGE